MSPDEMDAALIRACAEDDQAIAAATKDGDQRALSRLLSTTSGAMALVHECRDGTLPGNVREKVIAMAAAQPAETVRDLFEPMIPTEQRVKRLGGSINSAELLAVKGDATRGEKVFFEMGGGLCQPCHRVGERGQEFGPDLTHIASKYMRSQILENILEPSKTIDPKYVMWVVKMKNGEDRVGLLLEKTGDEVVLKDGQRNVIRLAAKDVKKMLPQSISAMPEGLLGSLTAQEAGDLLEYLGTLKGGSEATGSVQSTIGDRWVWMVGAVIGVVLVLAALFRFRPAVRRSTGSAR